MFNMLGFFNWPGNKTGGGGGNWTRVQGPWTIEPYMLSLSLNFSLSHRQAGALRDSLLGSRPEPRRRGLESSSCVSRPLFRQEHPEKGRLL